MIQQHVLPYCAELQPQVFFSFEKPNLSHTLFFKTYAQTLAIRKMSTENLKSKTTEKPRATGPGTFQEPPKNLKGFSEVLERFQVPRGF